jgi:hypothetical protein
VLSEKWPFRLGQGQTARDQYWESLARTTVTAVRLIGCAARRKRLASELCPRDSTLASPFREGEGTGRRASGARRRVQHLLGGLSRAVTGVSHIVAPASSSEQQNGDAKHDRHVCHIEDACS